MVSIGFLILWENEQIPQQMTLAENNGVKW